MFQFIKYYNGYLKIKVFGFSPERFMNLCSNRDILLWDIEKHEDHYSMCISLKSFYKLESIVRKTKTKVVILERNGLPFLFPLLKKRIVFVAGCLIAILFCFCSEAFIWSIRLEGNSFVTREEMNRFLAENHIREGMFKWKADTGELEKKILRDFPEISWISVRIDGTKMYISIREDETRKYEDIEESEVCRNFVSEYDGKIVSIVVRTGTPCCKRGDQVKKGDVLIYGKIPIYNDDKTVRGYISCAADGDVVMEHTIGYQKEMKKDYLKKIYTGRVKTRRFIHFQSGEEWKNAVKIPFPVYDTVMQKKQIILFEKFPLPIFFGSYIYREYQNLETQYTAKQGKEMLREEYETFLETLIEKGVQIIEKNVKIETSESGWRIRGELRVRQTIHAGEDLTAYDVYGDFNNE